MVSRVNKKGTIYLPKHIMGSLGIKGGDKVLMKVEDGKLVSKSNGPVDPI